jgi:ABC-type multidrug transport system fused ATPase/permease subunit
MTVTSPVIATGATFATYVLIGDGNILTASDTFGVLLLFSALRFPINNAGRLIGKAAQAASAVRRISLFLDRPLRQDNSIEIKDKSDEGRRSQDTAIETDDSSDSDTNEFLLTLKDASFRIGDAIPVDSDEREASGFTVSTFDFSMTKGQVMAVCGPVGCGKSTLINGILEEAEALGASKVQINGPISYVPQTPFILNMTVRENILFGLPMDEKRYDRILDACALRPDLEQLGEAGDLTEIGERGVTLSGGQKQRVSLARAAYNAHASLFILDDPFSALDAGTGKTVFERLIASNEALLKDKAVVLVTHASHFITHRAVDKILLIVDGQNRFLGSWDELAHFHPSDENTRRAVDHIKSSVREDTDQNDSDGNTGEKAGDDEDVSKTKGGRLIQGEQREHGLSSLRTWLLWFQRAGGWKFMSLQILFMGIDRFVYVLVEWFLVRW